MNKKAAVIIGLQSIIIVVLAWVLVFYGKDEFEAYQHQEDKEIIPPSHVSQEQGRSVITLSPEAQQASGITTEILQPATYHSQLISYGTVIGIEPLTELRTRYLAARAEANVIRASIANTQQDYQRLLALNRDNRNVSDRAVQMAEAAWKSDEARLAAAETSIAGIRDAIRQQWGETLAKWATGPAGSPLDKLMARQEVLLQIALPFDDLSPEKLSTLKVVPAGSRSKPVTAIYVSPSPQTDSTLQGRTYFFRAPAHELRAGMRVEVSAHVPGKRAEGVVVPGSAVVWYAGKAWAYRKQGLDQFVRTWVDTTRPVGDGWFEMNGFRPGEAVVTSGTQLLLSEELKYQIKNENED
ncbi:MAG: hypothetical protein N2Z69_01410 [Methylophilaceae bacterium]|nr:hypothetical protein [Methylophilaceae bacterium]